jgi:hypothetical protein
MTHLRALFAPAAVLVSLALAAPGAAHETGSHTGFLSTVSYIEPPIPGLLVRVIGGHQRLSVANLTDRSIVIPGVDGRPPVTIDPHRTEVWDEPRVGANQDPPEREGLVRNWRIRGAADGEPFVIVGFLGYRPPPGVPHDEAGLPRWAIALLAAGGALILAAAAAAPLLVRRGRT